MTFFLLANKPAVTQYLWPRRNGGKVTGTYDIHTFESFPDWVGNDTGVENALYGYQLDRLSPGSYHDGVDSDSHISIIPWWYEAFHDRFTNNWAVGLSIATQASKWSSAPREWREKALKKAAEVAAMRADEIYLCTDLNKVARLKIDIPAVWLTQAQAHNREPGFVRHGTSDPTRRYDPWPNGAPESVFFLEHYKASRKTGRYASVNVVDAPPLAEAEKDETMNHWFFESPIKQNPTGGNHLFYYNSRNNVTVHVQDGNHKNVIEVVLKYTGDTIKPWGERNNMGQSSVVGDPRGFGLFNGPDYLTPVGTDNKPMNQVA